jgi:hypothetical protein
METEGPAVKHALSTRRPAFTKAIVLGVGTLTLLAARVDAQDAREPPRSVRTDARGVREPPPRGFKRVSSLVDLPSFMPGIGILYVRPETLPAGPFLAYDRAGRRVSTIYMIPVQDLQEQKKFDLAGLAGKNDHVSLYFNPGHAGVEVPHYHVVIWHVNKRGETRVAR